MAAIMADCRQAALKFAQALDTSDSFVKLYEPELDIVVYSVVPSSKAYSIQQLSAQNKRIFQNGMDSGPNGVFVSLFTVSAEDLAAVLPGIQLDAPTATVLRSVLMKPGQREFVPELIRRLEASIG